MVVVTALRPTRGGVAVELDGVAWRTFPVAAVVEAGLGVGLELDRPRARALARARRRHRGRTGRRAGPRAARAFAGVARHAARPRRGRRRGPCRSARARRAQSVSSTTTRFAERRARQLAERGAGDLLVARRSRASGRRRAQSARAAGRQHFPRRRSAPRRIVERRGLSARTLRYLASRGFSEDSLEPLIADIGSGALR